MIHPKSAKNGHLGFIRYTPLSCETNYSLITLYNRCVAVSSHISHYQQMAYIDLHAISLDKYTVYNTVPIGKVSGEIDIG